RRAGAHVPLRCEGHARHGRGRYSVQRAVRDGGVMRVPLSWLREYVDVAADASAEDVFAALVSVGFEEEELHAFELSGPIVVGQVLSFEEEPQKNGKTIRWCQVDTGEGEPRGIVCGASNF